MPTEFGSNAAVYSQLPTRITAGPASPGGHWDWAEIDNALQRQSAGWQGRTTLASWLDGHLPPAREGVSEHLADDALTEQPAPA